jgi:hypothetical protein
MASTTPPASLVIGPRNRGLLSFRKNKSRSPDNASTPRGKNLRGGEQHSRTISYPELKRFFDCCVGQFEWITIRNGDDSRQELTSQFFSFLEICSWTEIPKMS